MKTSSKKRIVSTPQPVIDPVTPIPIMIRKRGPTLKKLLKFELIRISLLLVLLVLVTSIYIVLNNNYRENFEESVDHIDQLIDH